MSLSGNQLTGLGATGFPNRAYLGFTDKVEVEAVEVLGGVKARKIRFENIEPAWRQKEKKKDWIDVEIERETLKLHKPDTINVSKTIDTQIKEIYTAKAAVKRIKKKRRNKALAMILMGM